MADDPQPVGFRFDLDSDAFNKGIGDAISKMGDLASSIGGPTTALLELVEAGGFVAAAFIAIKASIDMVEMAEDVAAVNAQFDILTDKAGLAGDELKKGILAATDGLATENDILKATNKAIIAMGDSAGRLPEIWALARQAATLTGEDVVTAFNGMSQSIESGNQRALRHYNIFVDTKKAVKDYADSLGVAENALSEAGQRQALMNAAIDAGNKSYKDVATNLRENTDSFTRFKVAMQEMGAAVAVVFNTLLGPAIAKIAASLTSVAHIAKTVMVENFGEGSAQASAAVENLKRNIDDVKERVDALQKKKADQPFLFNAGDQSMLDALNGKLKGLETQYDAATKKAQALKDVETKPTTGPNNSEPVTDPQKLLENQKKFETELEKLNQDRLTSETKTMTTMAQAEEHYDAEVLQLKKSAQTEIKAINASTDLDANQKAQLRAQVELTLDAKLKASQQDLLNFKIQASNNALMNAQTVDAQMAASAQQAALKSQKSWQDSGKVGGAAMTSLESHTTAAFKAMGDGSKSAGQAIEEALLGTIGDAAAAQGQFMVLDAFSTFPAVKVPELVAGGALIALGGALGAVGGSSSTDTSSSGGGDTTSQASPGASATVGASANQQVQPKTVSLTVQGSLYETQEAKLRLVEMIREASDATDFRINQIGN